MSQIFTFFSKHIGTRGKEILVLGLFVVIGMSSQMNLWWGLLFVPDILLVITLISLFYPKTKKQEAKPLLIDLMYQPHNKTKWGILSLFLFLGIACIIFKYAYYNSVISGFFVLAAGSLAVLLLLEQLRRPKQVKEDPHRGK